MKKNLVNRSLLALAILAGIGLLLVSGCRERGSLTRVNPAFREYIQAYTSGIISTQSVIKIRLADDFADTAALNMAVEGNYFRFKPDIKGKTYWTDRRTIEFHPDEKLPQDQVYTVEFFLSRLITVPDSLKTMIFQVETMKQEARVTIENHKAYSHDDLSREFLTGTVQTTDLADDLQVEKILKAIQEGRELPVIWSHDKKNRSHLFQVDSVRRGAAAGEVRIEWDGAPIGSKSEGSLKTEIPALNDFRMLNARSFASGQQCLLVQFSDPLKTGQNLDGLFRVGKLQDLRYSIDDNLLWIYLPEMQDKKTRLTLEPAIKNIQEKELGKRTITDIRIENAAPNVRFVGDGVVLPSSNGMLLPFEAVNLNAVDIKVVRIYEKNILPFLQVNDLAGNSELARVGRIVLKKTLPLKGVTDNGRWNRFSIDLSTLIKTEPGAIYSVILGFKKEYSTYLCSGADSLTRNTTEMMTFEDPEKESDKEWGYYSNYYDDDFNNGGWRKYRWEERDNPCKPSYYFNKTISRNVLASDLGIIAKAGNDGEFRVFVTDIVSSKPLSGVSVEFFNFQLQTLGQATTNGEGMVIIPMKRQPFILVAKSKNQTGYLKLTDGSALSLSMFDVSGEPVQNGIKGYLYGERGVWRPGDSLFLTFILEDKSHQLPANHPVSFSLISPAGQLMNRIVRTSSLNGFYCFNTATAPDAPTGNWLAKVNVGGAEFRKTLKIETVKPNRLKIIFDFKTDRLVKDNIPSASLNAAWLTGATARNLKAKVTMTLTKSVTAFKSYPGFVFDNPTAGFSAENITVFDGRLDASGTIMIKPVIHVTHIAPGALKASFETMVFEDGGDFSIDRFTLPYYPYSSYAGISVPAKKGGDRVLNTDNTYPVDLVNVDAFGKLVSSNKLKVEVYKLEWRWWWDDSEEGSADFISTAYIKPVDSAIIRT
ncbi:MAG: MG2 domain-containing protein, partial [Bacteroidota bacterium]